MKAKLRLSCGFLIVVLMLLFVSYNWFETEHHITKLDKNVANASKLIQVANASKLILIYTTLFGNPVWHGLQGKKLFTYYKDIRCKYSCHITYDKSRISEAHAVLFHARDVENERNGIYSAKKLKSARKKAKLSQKWIFLSHENPQIDKSIYIPYKQLFNWTATFSRSSDVFIPYGKYRKSVQYDKPLKNYAKGKKGLVAWAVSNCVQMRRDYTMELQHYINVTVYGKCRHNFMNQRNCKHNDPKCKEELSTYKFYLAFENSFCQDYVTEKYWERIYQETVPIVMGATYDDGLVIPGSYIDSSKFESIKALADYLKYLDSNDTAYNEYFSWKTHYTVDTESTSDLHCEVCTELYSEKFDVTTIMTLSEVFNADKTCFEPYKAKHAKFIKQTQDSRKNRPIIENRIFVNPLF